MKNKHKVPQKLWRTFKDSKHIFNSVMDESLKNQKNLTHPNQTLLPQEQWQTLVWNLACLAAWAHDNHKSLKD